jgi:hypothetical protein
MSKLSRAYQEPALIGGLTDPLNQRSALIGSEVVKPSELPLNGSKPGSAPSETSDCDKTRACGSWHYWCREPSRWIPRLVICFFPEFFAGAHATDPRYLLATRPCGATRTVREILSRLYRRRGAGGARKKKDVTVRIPSSPFKLDLGVIELSFAHSLLFPSAVYIL